MIKPEYKSFTLNNFKQLPVLSYLTKEQLVDIEVVGNVLPFKTNNYVIDELINWNNVPQDPMFILTFPQKNMLLNKHYREMFEKLRMNSSKEEIKYTANIIRSQLNPHPAGQMDFNIPEMNGIKLTGLQHKYQQTILFFPSNGQTCHAYCSFCFRWPQFVGIDEWKFAARETELLTQYVKEHKEITDILFTGGDPLIMKVKNLSQYIEPLLNEDLPHLQTIRIGTKAFSFWPYKFISDDDAGELLSLFAKIINKGKNLTIMAHFNHPVELSTEAVKEAIRLVRNTGAQIRTQSPVLRHINDTPDIWAEMWRKQVNLNCIPYYMFIPRDTGAQHFFAPTLVKAWEVFQQAYQKVSGVCRTVRGPSMSCTPGKIQILGVSEILLNGTRRKIITLRFLQGRNPDWVARPFFAEYNENALWIEDLKPAFGENKFFFEEELEKKYHLHITDEMPESLD